VIEQRVAAVRERIARAAAHAGRRAEDVTLVAVSKTHPAARVREAFDAGIRDFGENRVQEAESKAAELSALVPQGLRWHLVGHLQANKARKAAALFDRIHSVDGIEIGRRLDRLAAEQGRSPGVLVQVDLAGEPTKHGVVEEGLLALREDARTWKALRMDGLMILPPWSEEPEASRPFFRRLRELRDGARSRGLAAGSELSMGMSHDLEVAVEEGATLVRVGTALFGERARD
jgi:pyridoxal phosphate enzyme (YggS family)